MTSTSDASEDSDEQFKEEVEAIKEELDIDKRVAQLNSVSVYETNRYFNPPFLEIVRYWEQKNKRDQEAR